MIPIHKDSNQDMAIATSSTSTVVNVPVVSITGVVPTNSFDGFGNLFGTNLPVCQVLPKVHYMNKEQFKTIVKRKIKDSALTFKIHTRNSF